MTSITKTLLLGGFVTLNAVSFAATSTQSQTTPPSNAKSESPKLEMPSELKPVEVKASEDEMKKFAAMLENIMKSEKGLEIMQKVQLFAQYTEAKHEIETRELLDANKSRLIDAEKQIVLGNPKGTVTFVLVSDPLCPNCRVLEGLLRKVSKQNPSVRIIQHQWAFVNPEESARVARYLIAAYMTDVKAYPKLYEAFLALKEVPSQDMMEKLLTGANYNVAKVKESAESEEVKSRIESTKGLAKDLKFPGAPILMTLTPDGQLVLIPPVSEQELSKIVGDLTKAMASGGQTVATKS